MPNEMTPEQFDVLAGLLRPRAKTRAAARDVLVEGVRVPEAAKAAHIPKNYLYKSVVRFRTAHTKIIAAYLP